MLKVQNAAAELALVLGAVALARQRMLAGHRQQIQRDRIVRAEAVLLAVQFRALGTLLGWGRGRRIIRQLPW